MANLEKDDLLYVEDFDEDDFLSEDFSFADDLVYIEDFDDADYGIFESVEEDEDEDEESAEPLREDLKSSFPKPLFNEAQVRDAAKKVVKGAKIGIGYVKELKLAANYAQSKFVKKDGIQYPLVKALKVTECRGCTGVRYDRTEGAVALHNTQEYKDKLADKIAKTGTGFGTNIHDTEAGLENILVTTSSGKKCMLVYPLSTSKAHNTFYISVDGSDWKQTTKADIAQYMSPADAAKFLDPSLSAAKEAERQAVIYTRNGVEAVSVDELIITTATGEKLKVKTHPLNVTYLDPNSPFFGIFRLDKEVAINPVPEEATEDDIVADIAENDPLNQEFPNPDAEVHDIH